MSCQSHVQLYVSCRKKGEIRNIFTGNTAYDYAHFFQLSLSVCLDIWLEPEEVAGNRFQFRVASQSGYCRRLHAPAGDQRLHLSHRLSKVSDNLRKY